MTGSTPVGLTGGAALGQVGLVVPESWEQASPRQRGEADTGTRGECSGPDRSASKRGRDQRGPNVWVTQGGCVTWSGNRLKPVQRQSESGGGPDSLIRGMVSCGQQVPLAAVTRHCPWKPGPRPPATLLSSLQATGEGRQAGRRGRREESGPRKQEQGRPSIFTLRNGRGCARFRGREQCQGRAREEDLELAAAAGWGRQRGPEAGSREGRGRRWPTVGG